MAWDMNNGNTGKKTVTLRMDGNTRTFEFTNETTLGDAVRKVAREAGLTAVNVLADGEEVGQEDSKRAVGSFGGNLNIVPKDSGSNN